MCDDLSLQRRPFPLTSEEMTRPYRQSHRQFVEKDENILCRGSRPHNCADQTSLARFVKPGTGSFAGRQAFPRATKSQLYSECRGKKDIDFPCLDFLKISSGDFSAFRQLLLRHRSTHTLPANVRAKDSDSGPFFAVERHDILHRGDPKT
jgi:hypothetical protein